MNIRLVISDLDGTLLNDEKEVHPEFWEVYDELKAKGILFAIASGRQLYTMEEQFARIKDEIYFIGENGSIMKKRDDILHIDSLDKEDANKFIRLARTIPGVKAIVAAKNSAYIEGRDEPFYSRAKRFCHRLEVVDDLTQIDDVILKISIDDPQGPEGNSYPYFKEFESQFKIVISGPEWLDIASPTSSKGAAISLLKEKLGIKKDEVMVFGDYPNDLEMMDMGLHSYAMKNSHPQILAVSKYVTELDNNENGVVETLKKVLLQKKDVCPQEMV